MDYIIHGILQARILEWVAFPFSRGSSQLRDQTQVSCIAGGFFTSWATREAHLWKNPVLFWHHKIYITTAFFLMHLVCYLSILPTSLKHFEVYLLLLWIYQYIISLKSKAGSYFAFSLLFICLWSDRSQGHNLNWAQMSFFRHCLIFMRLGCIRDDQFNWI